MKFRPSRLALLAAGAALAGSALASAAAPARPNVLFLIADDLNTMLGCYGDRLAKTPHLDRLAARGVRFDRAYTPFPLCGPSRNSMLTGLYPNSNGIITNAQIFRQSVPERVSLPQAFRREGFFAARLGKLYHYNVPNSIGTDGHDDPASWDLELNPAGVDRREEHPKIFTLLPGRFGATLSWYASPHGDAKHTDGMLAGDAEWMLERFARRQEPFFLAVGFFRPHTPYVAPKAPYFDQYREDEMPVVTGIAADHADLPAAAIATRRKEEDAMGDDLRRRALLAYRASISFMDAQVGRVIGALDRLGLADHTVIVFTSDHGYHLGEHGLWQKMTLFEESTRVPLLIVAPHTSRAGGVVRAPVSHLDLYPTLTALCGVPAPEGLHGQSLVPLLRDPSQTGRGWVLSQVTRNAASVGAAGRKGGGKAAARAAAPGAPGAAPRFFGYTLRTPRWRYTEWDEGRHGRELYDHEADPRELTNLADQPHHSPTVERLSAELRTAVRSSFPASGKSPEVKEGLWAPLLVAP